MGSSTPALQQAEHEEEEASIVRTLPVHAANAALTHITTRVLIKTKHEALQLSVDNLRASPFLLQCVQEEIPKSPAAAKRAQSCARGVWAWLPSAGTLCLELDMDDGRRPPPMVKNATVQPGLGRSSERGADEILSAAAPRLIEESSGDEVLVTNTIPPKVQKLQCPKIKTVDIGLILSEAIRRIHNRQSMVYLFRNITVDDYLSRGTRPWNS
ncbi:Phosphoribosyl pyrophosphate synthase-associated protein 1 [Plecturocebus cupreus]